ncbi:hypothetical protein [Corallococcus sp. EGB]|uniref:hypothetical protein n=1 Tax=Corallococcus sp. EGB TaxID=1521117 RepID=UPI001CBE2EBE|nr:hypothetical protein [Corallococcus sp. EGB]
MLGLLLLGLSLAACRPGPGGGGDAGPEVDAGTEEDAGTEVDGGTEEDAGTQADAGAVFSTVTQDARLLAVDARQTYLISLRADGTYAQALPEGEAVRIADRAEAVHVASDGSAALLWSQAAEGLRSVWLWRPGTSSAIPLTLRSRGAVVHDAALSYAAFLEEEGAGVTSLFVVRTATCRPGNCAPIRPVQVEGGAPELHAGGPTLLLADGTKTWLVDAATGGVTDLGELPGKPFISPQGTRYGWSAEGKVLLFDTATGTLLWEQTWQDAKLPPWKLISTPIMMDEVHVFVNIEGPYSESQPPQVPLGHDLHACTEQGCQLKANISTCWEARMGEQPVLFCRVDPCPAVVCPPSRANSFRDASGDLITEVPPYVGPAYYTDPPVLTLGPAFSEGFTDTAVLIQDPRPLPYLHLEWAQRGVRPGWSLLQQGPSPAAPMVFVPGPRLLYRLQDHLVTWDRMQVVDLGALDGVPVEHGAAIVRDHPPALYLDMMKQNADRTVSNSILRVRL